MGTEKLGEGNVYIHYLGCGDDFIFIYVGWKLI